MNTKALKQKILDLAIHGKLVPQNPNDESASILLEKIREEIPKRVRNDKKTHDGMSKKAHAESSKAHAESSKGHAESSKGHAESSKGHAELGSASIPADEVPFDIPESWAWCRLGTICDYGKCKNAYPEDLTDDSWILDLEDIEKDSGKILQFITYKNRKSLSSKHIFKKGDLLYSKLRPYLNKVVIAPKDGFCTSEILPLDFNGVLDNHFAQFLLMSPYFLNMVNMVTYGIKMPRLGTEDAKKMLIPLPPLAEQKEIVRRLDVLFAKIDSLAQNAQELCKCTEDAKKVILQKAFRGEL